MTRRCRRLAGLSAATAVAGLAALPAALPAAAATMAAGSPAQAARHAPRGQPWIAITGMTRRFLAQGQKITITGIVVNPGGAPLPGMSVQLLSSSTALTSRAAMTSYLASPGQTGTDFAITGAVHNLAAPVPRHGTEQWSMTLAASQVGMTAFGVYPLSAQLTTAGVPVDYAHSFLPYWPGKQGAHTVRPLNIAWVWPLIDTPQQTVCHTLISNELAASLTGKGRLNGLLAAGESAAGRHAMLTWAIDPALLTDVSAMTRPYRVSGNCLNPAQERASGAAIAWLNGVHTAAAQQDFFTTPYADVDVAALVHHGLTNQLKAAIADGQAVASQARMPTGQAKILGAAQRVAPAVTGPIAWPAGGMADYGMLQSLAATGVKSVLLGSDFIRSPATVASLPNELGGNMNVLLADGGLTQLLSARRDRIPGLVPAAEVMPAGGHSLQRQAATFANEQLFLAETAMIAGQATGSNRAVIVAPPGHWNPVPGMAQALLAETGSAPWLRPASLAGLVSARTGDVQAQSPPGKRVVSTELSKRLLRNAARLSGQVQLLDNILTSHGKGYLSTAVDAVESSAWRGHRSAERPALQQVKQDIAYVRDQLGQVQIVGSQTVTLGGQNGIVPVSISNGLGQEITVRLNARTGSGGQLTIGKFNHLVTVLAHTQKTVRISVTSAQAATSTLNLTLSTPEGQLLPLPATSLTIAATHFGTLAIVIITIALVVFLVTATARAIRRGGPQDGVNPEAEDLDPMPSQRDPA